MQFVKGPYSLPEFKTLQRAYRIDPVRNPRERIPLAYAHTLEVRGHLQAANQSALTTAINELEVAFSETDEDVGFLEDDNTTASSHYLPHADTEFGVELVSLDWAPGVGIEYQTERTFTALFRAQYQADGHSNIISKRDTITITGDGGPLFAVVPLISGTPRKVQLAASSPCRAVQSGEVVGYSSRPPTEAPAYPNDEQTWLSSVTELDPERIGGVLRNFRTLWNYSFERTTPFGS